MSEEKKFVTENFRGAVLLKDWMNYPPTGSNYQVFIGEISIIKAVDIVGFEVSKSESNWAALVKGKKSNLWILGCQIRGIISDPEMTANNVNCIEVR